jgi:iron complex transport system substrate-binding protein
MYRCIAAILATIFLVSCQRTSEQDVSDQHNSGFIRYAKGFFLRQHSSGFTEVTVLKPYPGAAKGIDYLLLPQHVTVPDNYRGKIIRLPVTKIVCTSTTHIPLLTYLDKTEALVGFPGLDYISSPPMRDRINRGEVAELGTDKFLNIEKLVELNPDMVMTYLVAADYGPYQKIEELGIPVVINAEYLESHPLGRAEWIKFMALFFQCESRADSVFRAIEYEYLETLEQARKATFRPVVFSGIMYRDTWFAPGGRNYGAKLLADAGCTYVWADDPSEEFLELSYEAVLDKAMDADLWIGVGSFVSRDEMRRADRRYTRFKAFQSHQVYTYHARLGPTGGNEYLESGYLRPDLILKDLVKIAHPEVLPDHQLYYYARLR